MDENDEFETDESTDEGEGIKQLRAALKAKDKELKELRDFKAQAESQNRSSTLAGLLKDAGAKEAWANFFPADSEVTEDAVSRWLSDNSEALGYEKPDSTQADPDDIEGARQMASASASAPPSNSGSIAEFLGKLNETDGGPEMDKLIQEYFVS